MYGVGKPKVVLVSRADLLSMEVSCSESWPGLLIAPKRTDFYDLRKKTFARGNSSVLKGIGAYSLFA